MIFRKFTAGLVLVALAAPALAGSNLPLVTQSGQTRQLPAGTTLATQPSTTGAASLNIPQGTSPTSPSNGDLWTTSGGVYAQIGGQTLGPFATQKEINVFEYMTPAQIADVKACTLGQDVVTPINNAISALPSTGGAVVLPAGCYKTTASISLTGKQNAAIKGTSQRGTIIQPTGNFAAIQAIGTFASGLGGTSVQNLSVICAGMANTSAMGVKLVYVNSGVLRDLYFNGCYHALDLYDQWQTVIDGIRVDGSGAQQNYIGTYLGAPTDATNPVPNNAVIMSNSTMQNVSQYGFHLVFFAGSKFVNDEAMNGVSGWKLCGVSYVISGQSCQFGHFANILADTTTGAGIDIQQGTNTNSVNNLMFDHVWMGNAVNYCLYVGGATYSQFDNLHCTATDNGVYLQNSSNVKISANVAQYNRNNNSSYAAVIDGGSNNSLWATNNQSAFPTGYNGIAELNSTSGNSIWGGLASCTAGLTFGGGSTGLTYSTRSCTYELRGRHVKMQYFLNLSAKGSSTGTALLTGLPFAVPATPAAAYGATNIALGASNMASLAGAIITEPSPGSFSANIYTQGATGSAALTEANFTNTSTFTGTFEYMKQ